MKPIHLVLLALAALAVPALVVGSYVVGVVIGLRPFEKKPPPQPIVRYVMRPVPSASTSISPPAHEIAESDASH
jgi:hypothetical protein